MRSRSHDEIGDSIEPLGIGPLGSRIAPSRRLHPSFQRLAVVLSVVALVAVACGDDDAGSTTGESAATEGSTTVAEPSAASPGTTSSTSTETREGRGSPAPESTAPAFDPAAVTVESFDVPAGSRPHDVWASDDGTVWYTGQNRGVLGRLDPTTGSVQEIDLGAESRPHGVITGPDGAVWVTDGGLNAIVRIDPTTLDVATLPLPDSHPNANLNTATFDADGTLWFTGQNGVYGRVDPESGDVTTFDAPRGAGPYGITATADAVYYASLAGSHLARIDPATSEAAVLEPPTPDQGTRRAWADSQGTIWTSQWDAGQVAVYNPSTNAWKEWRLPGDDPAAYAVYVDENDRIWLSDFGANALVHFDPVAETFKQIPLPSTPSDVRQIHGRPGEVWGAESAADRLVVVRTG